MISAQTSLSLGSSRAADAHRVGSGRSNGAQSLPSERHVFGPVSGRKCLVAPSIFYYDEFILVSFCFVHRKRRSWS